MFEIIKKAAYIFLILAVLTIEVRAIDDNPPAYGSITGSVIDALSKEPIPYANVVVRSSSDSILAGGITDDKGEFKIQSIPEGNSKVEIQFIGYEKITQEIDVSRENAKHDLSIISLSESTQQLEEVVVRGELSSVTQKIDRKVINVGKDLTATGTSASELLNNVQSVSVNPQTGAISLRGNENVKILVDGRPTNVSAAQLLKQIPSSSIKSIELITNPSAKYNPEGMSGIINIVLYKNSALGFNGSVNGGVNYGKNAKFNGAADLNYRKGKVNLFANYGGTTGTSESGGDIYRSDNMSHQNLYGDSENSSHLLKAGADIYLNKFNTLSFYTTQNIFRGTGFKTTDIFFEEILESQNLRELEDENYTGSYNLNYNRDFRKEGHNIEFEASHSMTDKMIAGVYQQVLDRTDLSSNYMEDINDDMSSTIFNVDYTNPLGENAKLELGLEGRFRSVDNVYNTDRHEFVYDEDNNRIPDGNGWYETEPMGNSSFNYDRSILSAYTNYAQQFGKLSMQVGVRLEQYDVKANFTQGEETDTYNDNRFTAYPSAFFTYAPSQKNQFQVSYSRRVDRPSVSQVNPIRSSFSSPLTIFVGNPELTPQFTDSYEFNYTRGFKKGSASAGIFYRRINNNITRYTETDPLDPNKTLVSFNNGEGEDRYGFEMSGMYRPTKWWSLNASLDIYYQLIAGYSYGEYVEIENLAKNFRFNNSFKATDKLSFQLFGMYRGKRQIIQYEFKPMWMISAGASYRVFGEKGTITLNLTDLFNTMFFSFESTNFNPSYGNFNWESRSVFLGYSHSFGRGDFKSRKRRSRDSGEMSGGGGF